ncbi:MAG TPA: hypothetical protein VH855_06250 [Acetobacteraceae bacterium]|jgi:hypothetical protein
MLRVGFLPSDFNPMVLMLGEPEDLRRLAAALRRFARDPADTPIEHSSVRLSAGAGPLGIHAAAEPGAFLWRLDQAHAQAFADQVDQLAQPSRLAGSEILACTTEEEIPVKVSRGEYTDDFLLARDDRRRNRP